MESLALRLLRGFDGLVDGRHYLIHFFLVSGEESIPFLFGVNELVAHLDFEVAGYARVFIADDVDFTDIVTESFLDGFLGGTIVPPVTSSTTPLYRYRNGCHGSLELKSKKQKGLTKFD